MSSSRTSLQGKVALVTGSSRGIGAAIARRLARDGASVVLHGRTLSKEIEAVAASIHAGGGTAGMVFGDLADGETASQLVREAFDKHSALDILVLNAGGGIGGLAEKQNFETIERIISFNLRSTILAATEFARLTKSEQGRIVYLSSGMATHPAPGVSIGAAAKAGGEAFMRCFAQEVGARGITCNSVAPGCTRTEMIAGQSWPDKVPPWTALGRLGEPQDIAEVVAFLASEEARWLTGITVPANGGLVTTAANILARSR